MDGIVLGRTRAGIDISAFLIGNVGIVEIVMLGILAGVSLLLVRGRAMAVRESLGTVGPNGNRGERFATQNFLDLGFGRGAFFQDFIGNRAHNAMAFTTPGPCGRRRKKEGQNTENADAVKHNTLSTSN